MTSFRTLIVRDRHDQIIDEIDLGEDFSPTDEQMAHALLDRIHVGAHRVELVKTQEVRRHEH